MKLRSDVGDDPTQPIPEPVNLAQVDEDLFTLANLFPAFGKLMVREAEHEESAKPALTAWGAPIDPDADDPDDDPLSNDDIAVLLAEHETDADFNADCERRLDGYDIAGTITS